MNPPYGQRMALEQRREFYGLLGDTLKQRYAGYRVFILTGDLQAHKMIGLKPTMKLPLSNGGMEVMMERLLEQYLPPFEQVDFWIESSCMEILYALVFMVLKGMIENKAYQNKDPMSNRIVGKIKSYLQQIDEEVDGVNRLKELMYEPKILREMLSQRR